MEKTVNERTNLLVDYFGKFISRAVVEPDIRSSESLISNETLCEAELEWRGKLNCLQSYVDYLETRKLPQFARLMRAFDKISEYFKKATLKCDDVVEKKRCKRLIVSDFSSFEVRVDVTREKIYYYWQARLYHNRQQVFENRLKLFFDNFMEYHENSSICAPVKINQTSETWERLMSFSKWKGKVNWNLKIFFLCI